MHVHVHVHVLTFYSARLAACAVRCHPHFDAVPYRFALAEFNVAKGTKDVKVTMLRDWTSDSRAFLQTAEAQLRSRTSQYLRFNYARHMPVLFPHDAVAVPNTLSQKLVCAARVTIPLTHCCCCCCCRHGLEWAQLGRR